MPIRPGTFLVSSPSMDDPYFEKAVILITEYNEKGAAGFVINKRFPRVLNELVEFRHAKAFHLYEGGPVAREELFFLHRRPDLVNGATPVSGDIYLGGNFEQVLRSINNKTLTEKDIKLFIGYCGWDHEELDAEMEEGSWIISKEALDVFQQAT